MPELRGIADALLEENIRQTRHAIEVAGRDIALQRTTFVSDGAGGQKPATTPTTLAAKRRYFVPVVGDADERFNIPGTSTMAEYVLIGMPDDDIQEEDFFVINGKRYDVRWVSDEHQYQVKALVVRHV